MSAPRTNLPTCGRAHARTVLLALCLAGAAPALAQPAETPDEEERARARRHNERARELFLLGRFREAAAEYAAAYQAKPLPDFLFNMGQCYQRLDTAPDLERAIFHYRGYLNAAPAAPDRAAVEARIAGIRERLARLAPPPPATKPPAPVQPDSGATPPRRETPRPRRGAAAVDFTQNRQIKAGPTPIYRRWWLWTAIGVAVVGGTVAAVVAATTGGDSRVPGGPAHDYSTFKLEAAP